MSQISKKQAKEALGGLIILTSMLEAANGSSSRFDNLLKQVDTAKKLVELYIKKDMEPQQKTVEAPKLEVGNVTPIKPNEVSLDISQPRSGGKVTKVKA